MKFETHAVLSTVTGRLMGDIGGVYKVTSFLIGRDAYTHELVFYGRKARDVLKNALPELPTEDDFKHVNEKNVHDVRAEWEAKLGTEIDVPDHLRDCLADERNPISTLREMAPEYVHLARRVDRKPNLTRSPRKMTKIELVCPESFITDAARPLLKLCSEMIDYPRVEPKVAKARKHIEKAMALLDEAYSDLR